MKPELSVIVPVYNSQQYLTQCIESILGQTYRNLELILVDDGSVDMSGRICDAYREKDGRVSVIHKENEGPVQTRLCGAEHAKGRFLAFVDGDDWIERDAYEIMMSFTDGMDAVVSGIYRYYAENAIKIDRPMLKEGIYDRDAIEKKIFPCMLWSRKRNTWELDPSLCTKIFRKDLLLMCMRKSADLDIHFGDDTSVVFPFFLQADSVAVTHQCYYYHRHRKQGKVPSYLADDAFFSKLYRLYAYLKTEFQKSPYWELLHPQLEHFYLNAVQLKQLVFSDYREMEEDIFPFWEIPKDASVVLYGAGDTGKRFYEQNKQYQFCRIVLWADRNYEKLKQENSIIESLECIDSKAFDFAVIAVRSAGLAQEIAEMLVERGIPAEKIVWNGVRIKKNMQTEKG